MKSVLRTGEIPLRGMKSQVMKSAYGGIKDGFPFTVSGANDFIRRADFILAGARISPLRLQGFHFPKGFR